MDALSNVSVALDKESRNEEDMQWPDYAMQNRKRVQEVFAIIESHTTSTFPKNCHNLTFALIIYFTFAIFYDQCIPLFFNNHYISTLHYWHTPLSPFIIITRKDKHSRVRSCYLRSDILTRYQLLIIFTYKCWRYQWLNLCDGRCETLHVVNSDW